MASSERTQNDGARHRHPRSDYGRQLSIIPASRAFVRRGLSRRL
jgi:hypothetical protein